MKRVHCHAQGLASERVPQKYGGPLKLRQLVILLQCLFAAVASGFAQTNSVLLLPEDDPLTPATLKLVWPATPGLRYEIQQSTNLQSWTIAPGFPAIASGPAQQMPFETNGIARFFRVVELDEQPPGIVSQYPAAGGFAVPRFANLTLQLSDATGINTNTIQFTVGNLGNFTLASPQLTFNGSVLTFLNGGTPLGGWGSNIQATLIVADTLGYATTNTWSFDLEVQPQVVTNLFVFGSPQAQSSGQLVGSTPTAALAQRFASKPVNAGEPWTLALVASNRLELTYTDTAPGFVTNTYVCNLTPASPVEIFNRKIISLTDDPGNKRLTLFTVEVPLYEIASNGTATISADSMILTMGTNGAFAQASSVVGDITFPRIGYSLDGAQFTLKDTVGGFDIASLTMEEQYWWLTPRLQVALELGLGSVKRFEAIASGNVEAASVWNAQFTLIGVALETTIFDLPTALEPKTWMYVGSIGPVPVYASLGFDVKLKGRAEVNSTVSFRAGLRQTMDAAFGVVYEKPDVRWVNTFQFPPPEVVPFTASINAEGSVKLSLEPALEFLVYGLAGVSAGVTPSAGIVFEAGSGQPLSGRLEAEVTLDLALAGPAFDFFPALPEFSLPLWQDEWHLFPDDPVLSFTQHPQSQTVPVGGSAYFSCTVTGPASPTYQWHFNGVPMPGQASRTLLIPNVTTGHAGNYHVRASAAGQSVNSSPATLTVTTPAVQTGLIAWYPFNGNANDATGNGHHGSVSGAVLATDRLGAANSAYRFNGQQQRITVPPSGQFEFTDAMTVAAWIQRSELGRVDAIIGKDANQPGGTAHFEFYIDTTNRLNFHFWLPGWTRLTATSVSMDTNWHHVAATYDRSKMSLYLDGLKVAEKSETAAMKATGEGLQIGEKQSSSPFDYFKGRMDEVRIYNYAVSQTAVQELYNQSLPSAPNSMALIPGGTFTMGNTFTEGDSDEVPLHTVYVSAFYMDRYEVTKALWVDVYNWAIGNGYSFANAGMGKAASHPVQTINWYDAVKWCNARSEKEGRVPAYYTSAAQTTVYRSGQVDVSNSWVNWSSGYRLPTEAEWEKAARGGADGQRFPQGSLISHNLANYFGSTNNYVYDLGPNGYHPLGNYPTTSPGTSPVASFAPNGYGLYDMAGNVWDWCWDLYGAYSSGLQTDPRGSPSGSNRVLRGGSWLANAFICRTANRGSNSPSHTAFLVGFRSVLPPSQ